MPPKVAILATGSMGAAVGRRLTGHGVAVLTCLEGRSEASRRRAEAAGMVAVEQPAQLAEADIFLSILPPSEALALARRMAPILGPRRILYVDCNAVSPGTARAVGEVVTAAGCAFVDAGIIGPPPSDNGNATRIYASGEHAARFAELRHYGLDIPVLDGPNGAASALKLSYAGISKGIVALGTAMLLAATRAGAADALRHELEVSQSSVLAGLRRTIPNMYSKAYRFAGEMEEIAAFIGDGRPEAEIYRGMAGLYERVAADVAGEAREIGVLDAILKPREG
jgi:3-hydroxyisobutyrate dehydrogenase-like beta-hydroxyacid dehydrogenase